MKEIKLDFSRVWSQSGYARKMKISRQAVHKQLKEGKLKKIILPDGTVLVYD